MNNAPVEVELCALALAATPIETGSQVKSVALVF